MVEAVRAAAVGGSGRAAPEKNAALDGGFFPRAGGAAPPRNASVSTIPSIGLESMLALQAVDEDQEHDRRARKRGAAMVAALSDLQRAMLAEEDPALALRSLSELATGDPAAADPGLAAILRAVVLRSRIEVARREARHG